MDSRQQISDADFNSAILKLIDIFKKEWGEWKKKGKGERGKGCLTLDSIMNTASLPRNWVRCLTYKQLIELCQIFTQHVTEPLHDRVVPELIQRTKGLESLIALAHQAPSGSRLEQSVMFSLAPHLGKLEEMFKNYRLHCQLRLKIEMENERELKIELERKKNKNLRKEKAREKR